METKFQEIPLSKIKLDPNQPRKYIDEDSLGELTASVLENGVIQPIVVRPSGDEYLCVVGERRLRASIAVSILDKKRNTIPATVKVLDDQEALQYQIIENLQRADVHPMEEAKAFLQLLEKGLLVEEIAQKVAKSDYYVRQRLKLCSLNEQWQTIFYEGRMSVSTALKIAVFSDQIQSEILNDVGNPSGMVNLQTWQLNKYKGNLLSACFALDDATLNKKAGACTLCPHNSASSCLFPEDAQNPICSNRTCFANKTELQFIINLESAKEEPGIIFLIDSYQEDKEAKIAGDLRKQGFEVINLSQCSTVHKHDFPTIEELRGDNEMEDNEDQLTEEQLQDKLKELIDEYNKEQEDLLKKAKSGIYKTAFLITGMNKGKTIYISLDKRSSSKPAKTKLKELEADKITVDHIDAEIVRLKQLNARSIELDGEKVWAQVRDIIKPKAKEILVDTPLTQVEKDALAVALSNSLGYDWEHFTKITGKKFSKITDKQLARLLRAFAISKLTISYGSHLKADSTNFHSYNILSQYLSKEIQLIADDQKAIALRRKEKFDQKISALQAQKKTLTKETTKKAPVKKSAKKK